MKNIGMDVVRCIPEQIIIVCGQTFEFVINDLSVQKPVGLLMLELNEQRRSDELLLYSIYAFVVALTKLGTEMKYKYRASLNGKLYR